MPRIKVVVFDFDGVLVDSENMKRRALKDNFLEFGEEFAQKVFEYQETTGSNRYDVADYAAYKLGKDQEFANRYADKYTKTVKEKIIAMSNVPSCESTLSLLVKKYPLYISSGTPTDDLKEILVAKTMRHLFKEIYGSPSPKIDHFVEIMAREKISNPEEILFIGDMEEDFSVAQSFDLDFLAINYRGDKNKVTEVDRLFDIVGYLKKNEDMHTKFRYQN